MTDIVTIFGTRLFIWFTQTFHDCYDAIPVMHQHWRTINPKNQLCAGVLTSYLQCAFCDIHFNNNPNIVSGKSPTAVQIAGPATSTSMGFGVMNFADDALTVGQDQGSEVIGRAQGLYAPTSQEEVALLMVMNYVFTKGEYNGSSIAILGRNPLLQDVREMPIVGGTGLFRFARGYALAHTVWANPQGDATVEYNVYVSHFDQME
ncbi:hypothetical protein Cgig2_000173 [Carnegiea gigantea]|uniref:Dirigent protein n=1 Tax=Carnegiea gigantea TaxID=171969 RepID=A0A9Q1QLD7_9CARY|nr:hypothetical protein Cgig2_000173 [Carnegiea gigantea]